jgi:hypothetical protein
MLPDEAKDLAGSEAVDPLTDWQVQDIGGSQLEVSSASRHERRMRLHRDSTSGAWESIKIKRAGGLAY